MITRLIPLVLLASFVLVGCEDKKAQESITQLTTKLTESEKKVATLEEQISKMEQDMTQVKSTVSRLGEVAVNLQRINEHKGGKTAAKAKPAAKAVSATKKKPTHKKHH